ncbi:RND efflux system, membrane fusion protein (MFP) [Desulfosarcina variabilis str. Montpellier]|uniref:efflux RND transporter periplasmic adaptor subunit n=1 Tax=Desulfosarcina variabilis TaxID=2300 RepID=UPI003AFAE8AE
MNTTHQPQHPSQESVSHPPHRPHKLRTLIVCLIIIGLGIAGATYVKRTAPQARKRPPERITPLVETTRLVTTTHQVVLTAMGSVVPAREMILKTRVSGQIQSVHPEFIEGGLLTAGEKILKIDPTDYELAMARAKSDVANAEYQLKVEMGYQDVARREWALLGPKQAADTQEAELALRKPHLAKAQSDLAAAQADLEQARLDLGRTQITAPFNAIVRRKNVVVGSQVTVQDELAELVGTDEYWIQVSLPVERLSWIRIPRTNHEKGAEATIFYRGNQRQGRVARLLSDLETEGRMARVLVTVKDPLRLAAGDRESGPPLLIGEYVRVDIQGQQLKDVYRIPRGALRDGGNIWTLTDAKTLKIVPVKTVWRDADAVLVRNGFASDQRIIVSDLPVAVDGMAVRQAGAMPPKERSTPNERSGQTNR